MLPQVGRLGEGLVAHRAGVRLEAKVDVLVPPQTAGVLEGLWAAVTGVRALASMLAQVILVMRAPFKGQRTIGTQEVTHSSVDTLMDLETRRRYRRWIWCSFETIWFHLVMKSFCSTPHLEQRGAFEGLATLLTLVRLVPRVRPAERNARDAFS